MRTTTKINWREEPPVASGVLYQLSSAPGDDDDSDAADKPQASASPGREDLPYKVELWDAAKASIEQVLAVTRNGSIGYAAFYEATRQFPSRYITLRHKGRVLSRWNGPTH
ncbi:MAG TPA: hypothetical protein VGB82_04520 [Alphaproteobacteria bacterium]